MSIYGRSEDPADSGSLDSNYLAAGQAAYQAFLIAKGLYDEAPWELLVWAEQYAWCQAARAVRGIKS